MCSHQLARLPVVTPPRGLRAGWCEDRCQHNGECHCFKAQFRQLCQSCRRYIEEGHCICHSGPAGWVHVRCEGDERRGLLSIKSGLCRVRPESELQLEDGRPSSRRRRLFGNDECTSPAFSSSSDDPECTALVRREEGKSEAQDQDEHTESFSPFTREQENIKAHLPDPGGMPVCVNALAGCGKTTTIAMLCDDFQKSYPKSNKLYLVFNKKNQDEAMQSGKFPKTNMEIRTTHAFVLRNYFGSINIRNVNPKENYDLADIEKECGISTDVSDLLPSIDRRSGRFKRIVKSVTSYVRRTLHNFQASSDTNVGEIHIFWRAKKNTNLSSRTKWREKIPLRRYKEWAAHYFSLVVERCHRVRDNGSIEEGITFDGYIKVAQLEQEKRCLTFRFDFVIVDEAQDFTPCQADLFWGSRSARAGKAIYLFGDRYQQLYRFRGAGHSFSEISDAPTSPSYSLTGSFRFGAKIAEASSLLLKALSGPDLQGRAKNPGKIHDEEQFDGKGVVLCRTNKGMYEYLFSRRPNRWCYLSGSKQFFPEPPKWVFHLEAFLREVDFGRDDEDSQPFEDEQASTEATFRYKGELFSSIAEIEEYIDDEGDTELMRYLGLLNFLRSQSETLDGFREAIKESFTPLDGDPDNFDGTVLGTVHKAKGLEFSKVFIANDFKFKLLEEATVCDGRYRDEANILYVAITRAKEHLFLSDGAKDFLETLSKKFEHKAIGIQSFASLHQIRVAAEEKWQCFQSKQNEIKTLLDVAWPNNEDLDHLPLDYKMTEQEQRNYLRSILLRYHPDKFLPRFGELIVDEELRSEIKGKLSDIVKECQKAQRSLQNSDETA